MNLLILIILTLELAGSICSKPCSTIMAPHKRSQKPPKAAAKAPALDAAPAPATLIEDGTQPYGETQVDEEMAPTLQMSPDGQMPDTDELFGGEEAFPPPPPPHLQI